MRTPEYAGRASELASQTTNIANLSVRDLLDMQLPFVDLPDQRRMAARLRLQLDEATNLGRHLRTARVFIQSLSEATRRDFMEDLLGQRVPIGAIVSAPGAITDGPFGSNLKTDHYQASGVRVIRLGNIGLGRFIDLDRAFVTRDRAERLYRHRAEPGDVVVAALGDGVRPAGRACLVPSDLGPSIVKADCFRVRTNGSGLDGAFLTHVLNSPQMLALTEANARGATRPRLNLLMLKKITVPKPSLDEQRRLVAELDDRLATIGALDASNRAQQEAADLLPTTLLRTAFNEITA